MHPTRPFALMLAAIAALAAACAVQAPPSRTGTEAVPAPRADASFVLVGGTVVDGSGSAPFTADVLVRGDTLVAVGPALAASQPASVRRIDVRGRTIAPGFVEPHAHITTIDRDPDAANYVRQGVTTIVSSLHSLDQPYPLGTFLAGLRVAPNTVWTAGHTWERREVLGLANRAPTRDELARMKALAREAMDDGAIGLATGLEYVPATYALTPEIVEIARATARPGALYVTHLRDEGAQLLPSLDEAIAIGRAAGLPVHVDHLKTTGRAHWGGSAEALARIDAANASGLRTTFDVYPYTAYSTVSDVLFPSWALASGLDAFRERLRTPAVRARLLEEMARLYRDQTGGELTSVQFRDRPVGFEGRTLADYLRATGRPETLDAGYDALIELQAAGGFTAVFHAMDEGDVDAFFRHPRACASADGDLVTFGVGVPHPRSYGSFPRVLARYVRERRVLSLAAAIHAMTGRCAAAFGLADRGFVRAGLRADLVVFDAERIADTATFARPHAWPIGIDHVIVNGEFVVENGASTGRHPGRVLRLGADGRVR